MPEYFNCACCRCRQRRIPSVNNQKYCGKIECQKARKAKWQKNKMKTDPDYRENQKWAQKQWRDKNPNYYKQYRKRRPEYVKKNRHLQKYRNAKSRETNKIAKMDVSKPFYPMESKRYFLVPVDPLIAKMDTSKQLFTIISAD